MACDKGYRGECCCECEHRLKISVCSCSVCSKAEGYICILYHAMDHNYLCTHFSKKHGACEMFTVRKTAQPKEA